MRILEEVRPGYPIEVVNLAQIRAARALLNWSQGDLAAAAGLSIGTIKHIERGAQDARVSQLLAIETAFRQAGIVMNEPGDHRGEGRGVRFIKAEE
jgi:transcriptional regulator with XRE-family HTH domain